MQITIEELVNGYEDNNERGVKAYDGRLDVRPPYQREFVYKEKQRNQVIDTVKKGFPLNIMYWNVKDDGSFEILDGQQRTISICQYVRNDFSVSHNGMAKKFSRLPSDIQKKILHYKLDIFKCTGDEAERIEWFQVINIAGVVLRNQEIRNAVYPGPWTFDAKKMFSRRNCPAADVGKNHMGGEYIRQDYLQAIVKWISNDNIDGYMDEHCKDENADELWKYFEDVMSWAKLVFGENKGRAKTMREVPWGFLYNEHAHRELDSAALQSQVSKLFEDEEVQSKAGIYSYVLDGRERHLNIRAFKDSDKQTVFARQRGVCANNECGKDCTIEEMEADHIEPWSEGGRTDIDNCQMLCKDCNRRKGAR